MEESKTERFIRQSKERAEALEAESDSSQGQEVRPPKVIPRAAGATNIRRADAENVRKAPGNLRQIRSALEATLNSLRPSDFEDGDIEAAKTLARASLYVNGWNRREAYAFLHDIWAKANGEEREFEATRFTRAYTEWTPPEGLLSEGTSLDVTLYEPHAPAHWMTIVKIASLEHEHSERTGWADKLYVDDLVRVVELRFGREMKKDIPYGFEARWYSDLVSAGLPARRPFLIEGILRRAGEMILGGEKKIGKSHLMKELIVAACTGGMWIERKVQKCRVMLLNCENDEADEVNDIAEIAEMMGVDYRQLDLIVESYYGDEEPQIGNFFAGLELTVKELRIDLLVVDPIYTLISSFDTATGDVMDESSNKDVTRFLRFVRQLRERTGVAVVFSTHFRKGNSGDVSDRLVGAGAWTRHATAALYFTLIDLEEDPYPREAVDEAVRYRFAHDALLARGIAPAEGCRSGIELLLCAKDELGDEIEGLRDAMEAKVAPESYHATPVRVNADLRHGDDSWTLDMWWCYPRYIRDATGCLTEYSVKGAKQSDRAKRHEILGGPKPRRRKPAAEAPQKQKTGRAAPSQRVLDWLGENNVTAWVPIDDISAGTGLRKHEIVAAAQESTELEHRRNKQEKFVVRRANV